MDTYFSRPGQLRSQKARPEEMLRISNTRQLIHGHPLKFPYRLRRTIRQPALALGPDMLRRIEFGGIFGKPLDMNPGVFGQKILDRFSLMDQGLIPQKNHRPPEMAKKKSQKDGHIPALEIPDLKREVKPPVSALGRNRKRRNDRKSLAAVDMTHQRRLPPWRPCPPEKRNEHEAAFIQKSQMGAKCERFFLWPAIVSSSSARSPLRPFPGPVVPASGNSIPTPEAPARDGWNDSESQRSDGLPRPRGALSRGLWNSPKPEVLRAIDRPVFAFGQEKASEDDQALVFGPNLDLLSCEKPVAIGLGNLSKSRYILLPPQKSCPERATGWLGGGASPVAQGFLEVSCP